MSSCSWWMTYSLPVAPPSSVWPLQLLRRERWEGLAELAQGREIHWAKEAVLPRVGLEERNKVLGGASGPQVGPASLPVSILPCVCPWWCSACWRPSSSPTCWTWPPPSPHLCLTGSISCFYTAPAQGHAAPLCPGRETWTLPTCLVREVSTAHTSSSITSAFLLLPPSPQ